MKRLTIPLFGGFLAVVGLAFAVGAAMILYEFQQIRNTKLDVWSPATPSDCAVVLTGGPHRVREGLDVLARQEAKKLVISGVNPAAELEDIFPLWPYYGTVRREDVVLERRSRTTFGNARQSLAIVEALRCRSILLITSQAHMRRALQTFRAEFPKDIELRARTVPVSGGGVSPLSLPWSEVLIESVKSAFYWLWAY